MTTGKKICIFGVGGFGREVLCCLEDRLAPGDNLDQQVCFMVDDAYLTERRMMDVDVIARSEFDPARYDVVVAIGDPATRKKVVESLPAETTYATVVHPTAVVSRWVQLGEGSVVTAGTVLTCNITLGRHAHLNLQTTIGHDCVIGDFFTTAPGVRVSGTCTIGDCVYLGTAAAVREKISIGSGVVVGMGGIVVKSLIQPGVYVGNPARQRVG